VRTSNCLERMNLEIRRRLNVIGRHSSELGCLSLVYGITKEYSESKRAFLVSDITRQLWKRLKEKKKEMLEQLELEFYAA
jgi:transposase-like protein